MKELNPPAIVSEHENFATDEEIRTAYIAYERAGAVNLIRGRDIGFGLIKKKKQIGHGGWLSHVEAKLKIPNQRASEFMRLASNWDEIHSKLPPGGNLSVKEALKLITVEKPIDSEADGDDGVEAEAGFTESLTVLTGYTTLSAWNEMSDDQRLALLDARSGGKTFNAQGKNENIEWALWSWNPVTGCEHNCPYCYARDIANRFYEQGFEPSLWPERLSAPSNTPLPEKQIAEERAKGTDEGNARAMGLGNVFTCSMADLFGRWVPREWIDAVLLACRQAPRWNFLFLTKFPQRMAEFEFPDNAWVGTSVDCQARVKNAEKAFRKIKAGVKWLSCEPLIEPLQFEDIGAFDWVILGGASASNETPEWAPPREWVHAIELVAATAGVKVYEKSNLQLARLKEYPGLDPSAEDRAPESLRYLPEVK